MTLKRTMTAEKYLKQYEYACNVVRRCERELEAERMLIDAVRSPSDNDGMPHGSGISKPTEEKVMRISNKLERLADARLEAIRIRQEIFDTIMEINLDGIEADVLIERYVYLNKWEVVCNAVNYTWPTVRIAWHRGLDRVQEIIDTRIYT